jgi:hypothetical protein
MPNPASRWLQAFALQRRLHGLGEADQPFRRRRDRGTDAQTERPCATGATREALRTSMLFRATADVRCRAVMTSRAAKTHPMAVDDGLVSTRRSFATRGLTQS